MITPSFPLTATGRVLPRLALDFTTAVLDPRITFTRSGNTATVINSAGVISAINADLPRFDYDPITLACKGLLIETPSTNLLINSLIDGTSLATQTVSVTAIAHTLSFYGTGSVVLSGAHSATVAGTGAYPIRRTFTFTPTAGNLTLTVTGIVQFAQLEPLAIVTSFIPTDGTVKTRNGDIARMLGTNFSDWYNATEGTLVATATPAVAFTGVGMVAAILFDAAMNDAVRLEYVTVSNARVVLRESGSGNASATTSWPVGARRTIAAAYKSTGGAAAFNSAILPLTSTKVPVNPTKLSIGSADGVGNYLNGHLQAVEYYDARLTNANLQGASSATGSRSIIQSVLRSTVLS